MAGELGQWSVEVWESDKVGNMSRRIKSTYRPKGRGFGRGYPRALIEVEEPEEEPTIASKNIPPRPERKNEGASAFPGPALEADQQELAEPEPKTGGEHGGGPEPKTGGEHGDGPDVEGKVLPDPEPMKMPEAGEGQPQI
ncbi:X antigen family member 5-like [Cervus elaphus]|uniref:X antigen family member 5-like n=1 Tax=Cervus elaphus TaxID=9860 RepID=UPI001CC30F8D|nr:X antigen family member 5-like [Cervus elaphus]